VTATPGPGGLSEEQTERYSRHIVMPQIGRRGQAKLLAGRALIIGAGGLGSASSLYLAGAGVGVLGIVDSDDVEFSNLHRQMLYRTADVGRPKVERAAEALRARNGDVEVVCYRQRLTAANAAQIIGANWDLVVDCSDNFPARYLINDACVLLGVPNVHASVFQFEGQATVFIAGAGPCYRCVYPAPPPSGEVGSSRETGLLGVLPGVLGVIQATEALKLLLDIGRPLVGRLLTYDALSMRFQEFEVRRDPSCAVCGKGSSTTQLTDHEHCAEQRHGGPGGRRGAG